MMVNHTVHIAGPLKQVNKKHKTGRHRSKGAIRDALKGKVTVKTASTSFKPQQRKNDRRHHMNQLRKNKRLLAMALKRQLGRDNTPPFLVCILPLNLEISTKSALAILEHSDNDIVVDRSMDNIVYVNLPRLKQRFAFIEPPIGRGNELAVLDYLKVCDSTLLLVSALNNDGDLIDKWGHRIFNMMTAQGMPTPMVALMDLESINPKQRTNVKASIQKSITKLLPNEKIMQLDTNIQGLNVLRRIGGQKNTILPNKNNRPHLFGDRTEFVAGTMPSNCGILKVTGFVRGQSLNVNGLLHVPGLGDFQMDHIVIVSDPYKFEKNHSRPDAARIVRPDPKKQTSLQSENIPLAMDTEQMCPTEEEIMASQVENQHQKLMMKHDLCKERNVYDYQTAWVPDDGLSIDNDDNDSDDDDICSDEFMSCENVSSKMDMDDDDEEKVDANEDIVSTSGANADADADTIVQDDEKYDLQTDFHEERETLKKIKEARIDAMWPDEIDTPVDVEARIRFQKFRGLESFRTSPWDPNENLPSDYGRIYRFRNFDCAKRRILAAAKINGNSHKDDDDDDDNNDDDTIACGAYIIVHIANVSSEKWMQYRALNRMDGRGSGIIVYGLLPHEHQMSVLNVLLRRVPDSEMPIKSKEGLIMQCGYRRFVVNPIFSQHTNGDKHKFERYFRSDAMVVATFYAPLQFPPCPVLVFKTNPDETLAMVARGRLLSCDPRRIILKRLVLSGHPMHINRKSATIRYMFHNKDDVNYFKPIKLRTKCGRVGHIKESLGTHGHMKCVFDGQLRSYDTVFMYMYKRVYPKWSYDEYDAGRQCAVAPHDNDNDMANK